ncbi:MAG: methyltransferase domain-containing protein [Gammaproteobacteria bacterium]|nr:methyltransferase domain-containing protein [Gammaproteobacteria bacterium]
MKLYHQVERVFNELRALGIAADDPIDVARLVAFDQYHYLGTEAVDEAVRRLGLNPALQVLEVGSGIGGPSRHLAHSCGCQMTALELQNDLHDTALQLTARCGLDGRVRHVCGNVLDGVTPGGYDALVSWLTFLHIPERPQLYARCFEALKPGGGIYVEDYFARGTLTDCEREILVREVFCEHVPDMDEYRAELRAAGFENLELIDMSEAWAVFVQERWSGFRAMRERNMRLHGAEIIDGLEEFYSAVVELFAGGNLGGIRFVANKPLQ